MAEFQPAIGSGYLTAAEGHSVAVGGQPTAVLIRRPPSLVSLLLWFGTSMMPPSLQSLSVLVVSCWDSQLCKDECRGFRCHAGHARFGTASLLLPLSTAITSKKLLDQSSAAVYAIHPHFGGVFTYTLCTLQKIIILQDHIIPP